MNRSTAKWIVSTIQCRSCFQRVAHVESDFLCTPCHDHRQLFPSGESNARRRGHRFLTTDMLRSTPAPYATESVALANKRLVAHYFVGACDWYVVELDRATGDAFGHADLGLGFPEWGWFNLVELEQLLVNGLFVVERDLDFEPVTAAERGLV